MQIISFYLPQYHSTPNNDAWWGKGFTEWTNVAKAKKLYPGHYQPKVPSELGFYNLKYPEIRNQQADLAKEAGVTGFCYYHYWFGNGHEELDFPFKEVVRLKEPDFPFCLCWANETWYKKFWNSDGKVQSKKVLVEQLYPGENDNRAHFYSLLDSFRDSRYIRINGKLLFVIYKPMEFERLEDFMLQWNQLAEKEGLNGFHFVAYSLHIEQEYDKLKKLQFNAICSCRIGYGRQSKISGLIKKCANILFGLPRIFSYNKMKKQLVSDFERFHEDVYPTMVPNWDHTPRSTKYGYVYHGATPELFEQHALDVLNHIKNKKEENKICFLKSWNEWGEGNYMEPDLKYGRGWINALKNAVMKSKE